MRIPTDSDMRFDDPVYSGMSMSENIDQIATALHSSLDLINNAPKTTKGHNYKYAPLEVVLDIIRNAYKANGLFLLQTPWTPGEDQMGITTLITHTSGQWISSQFSIKIEVQRGMNLNQSCGTLLTYLRRYSAMSFNSSVKRLQASMVNNSNRFSKNSLSFNIIPQRIELNLFVFVVHKCMSPDHKCNLLYHT